MELNTPITYTENTTLTIEQSGTYQIEVHGASGNGGDGKSYNRIVFGDGTYKISASGGGGGGGGYACSKVKMNKNDTIVLSPGAVGQISTAIINSTVKDYKSLEVTHGKNGSSALGDGPTFSTTIGGAGGTASGGNQDNANGSRGGMGEQKTSVATPGSGGAPGNLNGNKGGNGGSGQISTEGVGTHEGEPGKPGFIIVTLLLVDPDSGSDEGETPTDPETPPGTTDPETPPGGTDPETPSQPSTTISGILTVTSIKELKKRVHDELADRKYYGAISSVASQINYNSLDSTIAIANEINTDIIGPLNLIDDKLTQENINNPIRYSYINDQLTTFEGNSNSNTGCREACTGFCSTACATVCGGGSCGNKCGDTCGDKCSGSCAKGDYYNPGSAGLGTSCSKVCQSGCTASCGSGCSGCSGNCTNNCGSCSTACKGSCGDGCEGNCGTGCGDCTNHCRDACYSDCGQGCEGCSGVCGSQGEGKTSSSSGGCKTDCSGDCVGYCGSGCGQLCTIACSESCDTWCSTSSSK